MMITRDSKGFTNAAEPIIRGIHNFGIIYSKVSLISKPWTIVFLVPNCVASVLDPKNLFHIKGK
jgi:hypothetical protein